MTSVVVMSVDEDKAAVLAVLEAETAAWMRRDIDALAEHWVHSPHSRFMISRPSAGTQVLDGWDAINASYRISVKHNPEANPETRIRRERMNIVVSGDTAWATYDQVGDTAGENFGMAGTAHEFKLFQRVGCKWKICCIVVMQRAIDHETCPLIEVASDRRVLWMNASAHAQIADHATLIISGGRLRARNRSHEAKLQAAVDWVSRQLHGDLPPSPFSRVERAVILGESDNATPLFCWVLVEDGKVLVTFNDEQLLKRRIAIAQSIYGLSTAQTQLAELVAQGHELSVAADKLGVSINTVRTHLQRMFERTGVHSQSALVGILLSAEAPIAR
jgi:DNA-binding CsgD family transcriptional regulator